MGEAILRNVYYDRILHKNHASLFFMTVSSSMKQLFLTSVCFFGLIFSATVCFSKAAGPASHAAKEASATNNQKTGAQEHSSAARESDMEGSISAGLSD